MIRGRGIQAWGSGHLGIQVWGLGAWGSRSGDRGPGDPGGAEEETRPVKTLQELPNPSKISPGFRAGKESQLITLAVINGFIPDNKRR